VTVGVKEKVLVATPKQKKETATPKKVHFENSPTAPSKGKAKSNQDIVDEIRQQVRQEHEDKKKAKRSEVDDDDDEPIIVKPKRRSTGKRKVGVHFYDQLRAEKGSKTRRKSTED